MSQTGKLGGFALAAVVVATSISGAAGLAYEVVWSRMLVIPLGNSADATALVLAAFMLGIAGGARLFGGVADRLRSPLKLYAWLEIALGVAALGVPAGIRLLGSSPVFQGGFSDRPAGAVAAFATAGLLVVLPSLAMGATLPVLVRALADTGARVRSRIGLVYGANTLGAAAGAAIAGFAAIPAYGMLVTCVGAASLSFAAALIAFGVRKVAGDPSSAITPRQEDEVSESRLPDRRTAIAALLAASVSGFAMLSAEVIWTRLLTFVFGHDTYAFAVHLAVVLAGLGIGGLVHRRLSGRDPAIVVGLLTGLCALALADFYWVASALVVELGRDPFGVGALGQLSSSLWLEFVRELAFTPVLVFVPAVLAGATFPAACALYVGPAGSAGRRVGAATLVSGVSSASGALITSFVLVAVLGIQGTLVALVLLGAAASLVVLWLTGRLVSRRRIALLAIPAMAALLVVAVLPSAQPRAMLLEAVGVRHQRILHYDESRVGTVSVTENVVNGEKQLFMNGVNEVTTRLVHDQSFKLLGHLGPLLHPRPSKGLMICFGAGLSAGAALVHPLASLDVIELSEAVLGAAEHFEAENAGVLGDDRLRVHVDDGRHYLAGSPEKYDLLMVDSTHPKAVDSWILYTQEFYRQMRDHLAPGGIAVQWVPLHGLSEREFKIIVRTFFSVFPETTLWVNVGFEVYGQAAYLKLVGTQEPLLIDYQELSRRLAEPRIRKDLEPYGMAAPEEILDSFLAGPRAVDAWTAGLPVQTDDRPIVPYTTSFSRGRRMTAPLLLGARSSLTQILRRMGDEEGAIRKRLERAVEAQGFLLAGDLDRARGIWPEGAKIKLFAERASQGKGYYLRLSEIYRDDPVKLFEIGSYLGNLGHGSEARKLYEKVLQLVPGDARATLNLALVMLDLGEAEGAVALLEQLVREEPDNGLFHYNLGVALDTIRAPERAATHLGLAVKLAPDLIGARLALADALIDKGELDRAEGELAEVVSRNRWVAEAWDMLGLVAAARRDWKLARTNHIRALQLEPYRAATHYNLGGALLEAGRVAEAAQAYHAALSIEPEDPEALNNLGLVYATARQYEKAVEYHARALEVEPGYAEAAYNLGLAHRARGRNAAAIEAFGLALELDPNLVPAAERLAELGVDDVKIKVE